MREPRLTSAAFTRQRRRRAPSDDGRVAFSQPPRG